jgi:uncharacterized protein (DUF2132 family)
MIIPSENLPMDFFSLLKSNFLLLPIMHEKAKDPLHGKRLDNILEELVDYYEGFEELGKHINIKCFTDNPSIKSSLKFLRKTDWARTKVESLYLYVLRQKKKAEKLNE